MYQYFEYKKIKPSRFEKDFGLSNGYWSVQKSREADIGSSVLEIVADNCRDLNIDWLITGRGNMLNLDQEDISPGLSPPYNCEWCKMKDELIGSLRQQIDTQSKLIDHLEEKKCPDEGQKRKAAS